MGAGGTGAPTAAGVGFASIFVEVEVVASTFFFFTTIGFESELFVDGVTVNRLESRSSDSGAFDPLNKVAVDGSMICWAMAEPL